MQSPYYPHTLTDEDISRLQKKEALEALGKKAWPAMRPVTGTCLVVKESFCPESTVTHAIAGRVMTMRLHGKSAFAHLQDRSGRLQVYFKQEIVGEKSFKELQDLIDLGDIIWCTGTLFTTKTGEITLQVTEWELLSKCMHAMPEKFHGIADIETKYRQRYLDIMTNPESKERFIKRSKIVTAVRNYLNAHEFLEVETPMLHPIPGGAAARPFITHHNTLATDFYLRIAPELYLKRLVVGGFERVYEINRNFRNEGVSTRHNPEFTMVEFYMAHQEYGYIMGFVEDMLRQVMLITNNALQVAYQEHTLDFEKPFRRLTVKEAIIEYGNLTEQQIAPDSIDTFLTSLGVKVENKEASYGQKLFILFEEVAEQKLIQPTFIVGYPIETSPLSKRDPLHPEFAARFELFIAGMELSNGFNELNDPFDQAERFKEQAKAHAAGDSEAMHYDAEYVTALEYGLPPTVGVGIGIDRLVMIATNTPSIKEVILFPALKKK
jgi:lysyl-tRNA synthetase class 2